MQTNCDLTWYAVTITAGAEVYTRSVIYGALWEDRRAVNARQSADVKADDIAVYIPKAHGGENIKAGDLLVKGVVTDEIGPGFTPTALKAKYPNTSARVKTVDRMDYGSAAMHHTQVGAA